MTLSEREMGMAASFCSHLPSSYGLMLMHMAAPFGQVLLVSKRQKRMTAHRDGKDLFPHPLVFLTEHSQSLLYAFGCFSLFSV